MDKYRFDDSSRKALERLRAPLAVYQFIDKRVATVLLSDGFCDLFEFEDKNEAYYTMDHNMYIDTHPDDVARIANEAYRFATEGGRYEAVYRSYSKKQNGYKIIHSIGDHVFTDDGVRLAYVWYTDEGIYTTGDDGASPNLSSVLGIALRRDSMVSAGYFDYLTGLPGMSYFFELAEGARNEMVSQGGEIALLYMDLCGMKYYNRKYGFTQGDTMLQRFASILKRYFGSECCSRFGSDHFCAFTCSNDLEGILKAIFDEISSIADIKMLPLRVGICTENSSTHEISALCDRAKYACDTMRNAFSSRWCYFDVGMLERAEHRRYIIAHLDDAIRNNRIKVVYQPIVRAANGRVCDEEALARWNDPVRGMLNPAEFIPILEESKQIYKLDLCVVEQILEKLRMQQEEGMFLVPQSVNISRVDFDTCDIVEEIRQRVDDAGISRSLIVIEVTESTIGTDFEFMKTQIERFQTLGFQVWMDDFGSGYSSLDVLQSIRFDLIKFDMRFMKEFNKAEKSRIMLTELVRMAVALDTDTLCEGVETAEQAEFLREIGCTMLQGFYFCRPISFEKIIERYETGTQIGFENPDESDYYAAIGKINLYDLAVFSDENQEAFEHYFRTMPMAVLETDDSCFCLVRCNNSYRSFLKKNFGDIPLGKRVGFNAHDGSFGEQFAHAVRECSNSGGKLLLDEKINDSTIHLFMKMVATNPVKGTKALAIVILAVTEGGA